MLSTFVGHGLFPLGLLLFILLMLPAPCFLAVRINAFIEVLLFAFEFAGLSLMAWLLCFGIIILVKQASVGVCIVLDDDATQAFKWVVQRNFWMGVSTAMTYLAVGFLYYFKKQVTDMTCRR
ncbi:hypothetical protein SPRG_12716 [Saprolegnia parasitica CBS 223.65]|uniref:Uncharacterized protein n=1 Tax=Saprolegnia parasitica (strain CBS 223.65) TaxID=695850 RepID=A0A067BZZ8_SAPPC|nr:hypothetical protein SPRG_12716 [Saprolegnia parasitica CBS 223.65]KDO22435.1 hypothetical protein SPRG_12716 [Saprolegnia parasitica CBS 223.65]|eukprot:XP_012206823.1 hypothetical protein SPRG_12716 [Saprolegnia parasitica CBS 223.65]